MDQFAAGEGPDPGHNEAALPDTGQKAAPEINVQQVADRVYRLMLADIRLERARGQWTYRPSRR